MTWHNKEVILCKTCKGEGLIHRHEVTDYHRNEYDVVSTECRQCEGKGRLWQITKVEFEKLK